MRQLKPNDEGVKKVEELKKYPNGCYYCNLILTYVRNTHSLGTLSKNKIASDLMKNGQMSLKTILKHIDELIENDYLIDDIRELEDSIIEMLQSIPTKKELITNPLRAIRITSFQDNDDKDEIINEIKKIFHGNKREKAIIHQSNITYSFKWDRELGEYEKIDEIKKIFRENEGKDLPSLKELKQDSPDLLRDIKLYFPEGLEKIKNKRKSSKTSIS